MKTTLAAIFVFGLLGIGSPAWISDAQARGQSDHRQDQRGSRGLPETHQQSRGHSGWQGQYSQRSAGQTSYRHNRYDGRYSSRQDYRRDSRRSNRYQYNTGGYVNRPIYRSHNSYAGQRHNRYYAPNRYIQPRGYYQNRWTVGSRLPVSYYGSSYYVDYRHYNLAPPPYGYRWVRVDRDVYLVAIGSGLVRDILYSLFY